MKQKYPDIDDFKKQAEQLLMTNAGKGTQSVAKEVAFALNDAYVAGLHQGRKEATK
jgi:hypothetical protein